MRVYNSLPFFLSAALGAASDSRSPRFDENPCIQVPSSNFVVLYPVLINQYFLTNETIIINGGLTININNAPVSISTVATGTSTSSSTGLPISPSTIISSSSSSTVSTTLTTAASTSVASTAVLPVSASLSSTSTSAAVPPTSNPATSTPSAPSSTASIPATSSTTSSSAAATATGQAFIDGMLFWHNYYRANNGASPLTWDPALASYAQAYADKCVFAHSGGPNGENLAEGTPTNYNYFVYLWYAEISSYNFASPDTATFSSWGHFSQLVWKDTTTLGCGYSTACAENYLVCEYSPPGNYITQAELAANVGAPLSSTYNIPPSS